jgi:hypothetical protein
MSQSSDSLASEGLSTLTPVNAKETARNNIVRELVETERKYVQDLEIMQVRRTHFLKIMQSLTLHRNIPMHCLKATA